MSANLQERIQYHDVDLKDLDDIYNLELNSYPHPWTKGILRDCIINHYDFLIAKYDNIIIGYVIAKISLYETHILNLTISNNYRKNGIASELLDMIFAKCYLMNSLDIYLETRIDNQPAINLYHKHGFKRVSIRKDYYKTSDGREDAIVFKKTIS
tara:strand:- start:8 stop:472 length:465 start_codon:yes stop_codon:yes gene_type:complete